MGCCKDLRGGPKVGQLAPLFEANAYVAGEFEKVSLKDYAGKWVVLFFYPLDFTFVCPTEIRGFAQHMEQFEQKNAVVVGCSTDSEHSHKAWFEKDLPEVKFPVLADVAHHMSSDYGVLIEEEGIALRGTFIIDPEGVLRYVVVSDLNVGRSVSETLRVLEALQTGELCPVEWDKSKQH